jgi:hypothetical protein
MPKGPKGEKRPADVIGNAVKVMRKATGEETDAVPEKSCHGWSAVSQYCGSPLRAKVAVLQFSFGLGRELINLRIFLLDH